MRSGAKPSVVPLNCLLCCRMFRSTCSQDFMHALQFVDQKTSSGVTVSFSFFSISTQMASSGFFFFRKRWDFAPSTSVEKLQQQKRGGDPLCLLVVTTVERLGFPPPVCLCRVIKVEHFKKVQYWGPFPDLYFSFQTPLEQHRMIYDTKQLSRSPRKQHI